MFDPQPAPDSSPSDEILTFAIESSEARDRLDRVLVARMPDVSRSVIQKWISEGRVALNGAPARSSQKVSPGDTVIVSVPPPEEPGLLPESIPLDIVYEDEHLAVINKPAGMVVHPAVGHATGTLVNALLARYPDMTHLDAWEEEAEDAAAQPLRPGIVHRLDKDTSGLIVVAKTADARQKLQEQFAQREVEKTYLGLVEGVPDALTGIIEAPIGRDPRQRKRMAVTDGGRSAQTRYSVLQTYGSYALLEIQPATGRTHQIRVHLAFIGHPIIGDTVYGHRKPRLQMPRQFLHAYRITFAHPVTNEKLTFTASLPDDLQQVLDKLTREQD